MGDDPSNMTNDELQETFARLCTLERGHEVYGVTAAKYGPTLRADLDALEAEIKARGIA